MKPRFLFRAWKARLRDQRAEVRSALNALGPGDLAVDVGANKGAHLYWMRRAVGPQGKVFAFEPQPELAAYLDGVVQTFGWKNVRVMACAVSDRLGSAHLHVPGGGNSPGASLEAHAATDRHDTHVCRLTTLDSELAGAGQVRFLKVDVEGHELSVLRGALQTLRTARPTVLFECEERHLSIHRTEDVFAFLKAEGYEGHFFCGEALRPLAEFRPEVHQKSVGDRFWDAPDYCNNFLFTPIR